ncbi:nucleotidyltransferase family protein [Sagittula sp. S175]|uniref:nucleotidyltransferase family protein n=1 Tax=Sagittula sp. S175 TaxID=3415129 RepID=UPI003C7E0DA9
MQKEVVVAFSKEEYSLLHDNDCAAELEYLLSLVGARQPCDPSESHISPTRLFELARLNKVLPLLPARATELPDSCSDLQNTLARVTLATASMNHKGLLSGIDITRKLNERGIGHLHLKGPLQQIALYGHYHRKPSADTDILVRPHQRRAAAECLYAEGYRTLEPHNAFWWTRFLGEQHFRHPQTGAMIDLHHALRQPGLPLSHNLNIFFETATTMVVGDMRMPVPDAAGRVLLMSHALAKAFLAREPVLSTVIDIRQALNGLENETAALGQLAKTTRQDHVLGLALSVVAAFFPDTPGLGIAPHPFENIGKNSLQRMIATPWIAGLPWPRRRQILYELCGTQRARYRVENARFVASEVLRRSLDVKRHLAGSPR